MAKNHFKFGSTEALLAHDTWMEYFQYGLMTASMNIAKELGEVPGFRKYSKYSRGIMPLDKHNTAIDTNVHRTPDCDWNKLRTDILRYGMANVDVSMVPPSESSSVASNQTSGMEPIKNIITIKKTKDQSYKQIAPDAYNLSMDYELAYDNKDINKRYFLHCAVTLKWIDKMISVNRWYNPEHNENGKVNLKDLVSDMYVAKKLGIPSLYYTNTRTPDDEDPRGGCNEGSCDV